jgi:hypothetical protein
VVTRQDLTPAQQAVQGAHAALSFAVTYPDVTRDWYDDGQVLVLLAAPDERWLALTELRLDGYKTVSFHEPDLDGQLTAICAEPAAAPRLSRLPLALGGGDRDD